MKTNDFFSKKSTIYAVLGLLGLMLTSCGSYQNKSYYDNDGIYGATNPKPKQYVANEKADEYQAYFSSLNNQNQNQDEIFTDVNSYSSYNDSIAKKATQSTNPQYTQNGYAGWGNNGSENVTVNVYGNNWGGGWNNFGWGGGWNGWGGGWNNFGWGGGWNNWGWDGFGWGGGWNGWYGNNWGWGGGWNNFGWGGGWNGWGGGWNGNYWGNHGWNGHGNGYVYGVGRRNSGGNYANGNGNSYYNSGQIGRASCRERV